MKDYGNWLENRIQLTIITVSTKGEKQGGAIQLVPPRCDQNLHKLYPNFEMTDEKKANWTKLQICYKLQIT